MKAAEVIRKLVCPDDVNCMLCGTEAGMGNGSGLCGRCVKGLLRYGGWRNIGKTPLHAAFEYGGGAAKLISGLKYENKRYMALPLIVGLTDLYSEDGLDVDGIVPVPLSKKRRRSRGYNQSDILARGLSERVGIPLWTDILSRVRDTAQQVGLDENERAQNVQGAFACARDMNGCRVALLDDVCTTGATLSACMQVLVERGAQVTLMAAATVDEFSGE